MNLRHQAPLHSTSTPFSYESISPAATSSLHLGTSFSRLLVHRHLAQSQHGTHIRLGFHFEPHEMVHEL